MEPIFIAGLIALTIAISATALFFYIRPAKNEYGIRLMTWDIEDTLEVIAAVCWLGWVTTFLILFTGLYTLTG